MSEMPVDRPEDEITLYTSRFGRAVDDAAARVTRASVLAGAAGILLWLAHDDEVRWTSLLWILGVVVLMLWSLLQLLLAYSAVKFAVRNAGELVRAKTTRSRLRETLVGFLTIVPLAGAMVLVFINNVLDVLASGGGN